MVVPDVEPPFRATFKGGVVKWDTPKAFTGAGARAVRLGDTVLRSSSAGPAALAVLSAAGRWR